MRQLATAIGERSQRLAWQVYGRIILHFSLRPRNAWWYAALAFIVVLGAYAGRWHWLLPAVAWSFVTLIAVASQTLSFAGHLLDERQQGLAQDYEDRLAEMSQEIQNSRYREGLNKEALDVADGYIRVLNNLNSHLEGELHRTHSVAESEYIRALHEHNARSIGELWKQELSSPEGGSSKPRRRGKPPGAYSFTRDDRVEIAREYLSLRYARGVSKKAAGDRAGAHYETIERWPQFKEALPEFEERYGPK